MVFLSEILIELLDDIPLASIQRLWFHHDVAPTYFCAPVRDWLGIAYRRPLYWMSGTCSIASMFTRYDIVGVFLKRPSQGTGVSRPSDSTNGFSCSSACCLYFGGPLVLQHGMTAIPRRAQACLDMHGRHFKHMP
ncbi:DUF4817 domain-containing protein [Trichonephila clavipes]|nr:DUF4817 domain-containing protein [Trichonephila clavipes]